MQKEKVQRCVLGMCNLDWCLLSGLILRPA